MYLHGLAGDAARERLGDAGVLASDLPDGLAIARKRLAAVAARKASNARLGFAARDAAPGAAPTDQRGVARPQGAACDIGAVERTP